MNIVKSITPARDRTAVPILYPAATTTGPCGLPYGGYVPFVGVVLLGRLHPEMPKDELRFTWNTPSVAESAETTNLRVASASAEWLIVAGSSPVVFFPIDVPVLSWRSASSVWPLKDVMVKTKSSPAWAA